MYNVAELLVFIGTNGWGGQKDPSGEKHYLNVVERFDRTKVISLTKSD